MDIIKILSILIIAAILAIVLKQYKEEYALIISVAAGIIALLFAAEKIISPINMLREKIEEFGIKSEYFSTAIKGLGLAYISSFIGDICRDCGQSSLAEKAEIAGKCAVFILCVPLSLTLLDTVLGFI
ncbi:MAG: stage III sporulation protein AD [Clostridia bacterium]|nr:stage III sporulation protein AD [Clostridia bacterium]MBQ2135472.1 stage III sporulation protein AD [Clostridia bacterium]MBQ2237023.1 stage III sporulation protein AD [Clostridia bacterium]MEE1184484.1 SpoIIIAC/SpoIIIAD family protein [Acutalibacteraceae bacterium]